MKNMKKNDTLFSALTRNKCKIEMIKWALQTLASFLQDPETLNIHICEEVKKYHEILFFKIYSQIWTSLVIFTSTFNYTCLQYTSAQKAEL